MEGGRVSTQHLIDVSSRRIGVVGGPRKIEQVRHRLNGAESVVAAVPGASLEIFTTKALTVLEGRAIGERITAMPARRHPGAIFAANDLLALGVLQALVLSGKIRVPEDPEDIVLVGYDDIDFAESAVVPLTSVEVLLREAEAGSAAVRQQFVFAPPARSVRVVSPQPCEASHRLMIPPACP